MVGVPFHRVVLLSSICFWAICSAGNVKVDTIKHVHLIFSNHLDIGFHSDLPGVPGTDADVMSTYFRDFYPAAISMAQQLRASGSDRYRYLTHCFLVSLYLDCPSQLGIYCPNPEEVEAFEAAVKRGDIVWHALPHNFQAEFMDADLLTAAVQLAHSLDQRFGLPPKRVMSQRDVPGLTRAAVPILAQAGVAAISVGVNSGSAPPGVPKNTPFIWRDEGTNTQLLAFWHPGGYSGWPLVDNADECVTVKGLQHALCAAWRQDNAGPHTVDEVTTIYAQVRSQFPNATVVAASTFDAFLTELEAVAPQLDLPVVTQEIGDTWIYGISSDPGKVAEYKALLRFRRSAKDRWDEPAFQRFTRLLLKIPEHTWGLSVAAYPGDWEHWNNADLKEAQSSLERFRIASDAWIRQRAYNAWAVQELGNTEAGNAARRVLTELKALQQAPSPQEPQFLAMTTDANLEFSSSSWEVRLDSATGAISGLAFKAGSTSLRCLSKVGGRRGGADCSALAPLNWASPQALMASLVYSTYNEESFSDFLADYHYSPTPWWSEFAKPNANKYGATRRDAVPRLTKVWRRHAPDGGLHVVTKAVFEADLISDKGAPEAVYFDISSSPGSDALYIDVVLENKTPTRLPEAMWLRWQPAAHAVDASSWAMSKLGQWIAPHEVMRNGSMSQHAVDDRGVRVRSADGASFLNIASLDAPLVSPGEPNPFPNVRHLPDMEHGMNFCLVDNTWGTNYVMWYPYQPQDATIRYRFIVTVEAAAAGDAVAEQ